MSKMKLVSKKEFYELKNNYPKRLTADVCGICEPPIESHNDFSDGKKWPESMIFKIVRYGMNDPRNEYYVSMDK